jgi:hypothetical protein
VTGNDPTDQALAVIASIFEKPAPKPETKVQGEAGETTPAEAAEPPDGHEDIPDAADLVPDTGDGSVAAEDVAVVRIETMEIVEVTLASSPEQAESAGFVGETEPLDIDGLTRFGPGPLEALRFKWTVRRVGDGYYVDETIGTTSQPIVTGPLSRAEALSFVDARDRRTRRRYERLRNEIVSGPSERGDENDDSEL